MSFMIPRFLGELDTYKISGFKPETGMIFIINRNRLGAGNNFLAKKIGLLSADHPEVDDHGR